MAALQQLNILSEEQNAESYDSSHSLILSHYSLSKTKEEILRGNYNCVLFRSRSAAWN